MREIAEMEGQMRDPVSGEEVPICNNRRDKTAGTNKASTMPQNSSKGTGSVSLE